MVAHLFFGLVLLLVTAATAAARDLPLLPNLHITPGVARHDLTLTKICNTKWGRDARHVTEAMKRQVFAAYGLSGNKDRACVADQHGQRCEIDHLISRELGGADDVRNLWPQPYGTHPWNAHTKDRIENRLHKEVCAKRITLQQAQHAIVRDWTAAYLRYFGDPGAAKPVKKRRKPKPH